MPAPLLSLTAPPPEGFSFEPSLDISRLRRGVFCLFSDNLSALETLIHPSAQELSGLLIVPGAKWEWKTAGPFCRHWIVPREIIPFLAGLVQPYCELIDRAQRSDDVVKAQEWDAQRAVQDRLFLSRVQIEFRDAMLKAERNLREAHRYLNQIIEFLPDATLVIDRDKKVVAWNKAMEKISGVRKEDMIGKGHFEYALPFYGERRPILVDLLYISDKEIDKKYNFVRREGHFLFAEVFAPKIYAGKGAYLLGSASLLYDQGGNVVGAIESIRDITERHQTMTELENAKKSAEEANEAKSKFLSNVSHEVRTPLNAIIGFAELIINAKDLESARGLANTVIHESDILLSLVNAILDQARIESGKMEIEYVFTDMDDLLGTVLKSVETQAKKKGLDLKLEKSADVPRYLCADRLRICQILLNLMNNSVKFTEQGGVTLSMREERREADNIWVRFEVCDTGPGIPDHKKSLIFERFAQIDLAATRKYGGAGLGLSLARGFVELMGGAIGFDSREGVGSTFWFVIPLQICGELEKAPAGVSAQRESEPLSVGRSILLVEDYIVNQEVARMHLEAAGYKVDIVADGVAALKACESKEYKLILMDIQMPEMDGFETTRRLRAKPGWMTRVAIVGLTANADEKNRKDCLAAGMDGVITKPIRRNTFLAEVARALSKEAIKTELNCNHAFSAC